MILATWMKFSIQHLGDDRNDIVNNKNAEEINAILRYDQDHILYYEAEIPLDKIFPDPEKFLNDSSRYFSFGFETGELEMPSMGSKGGQGGMGGGRGSGGKGGHGGQGGSSQADPERMSEMQSMSETSRVWVKKARLKIQNNK